MLHDAEPANVDGPTADELAAIEDEWPLIAAEIDLTGAEIHVLTAPHLTELDWRRLRRAECRVATEFRAWATRLGGDRAAAPPGRRVA